MANGSLKSYRKKRDPEKTPEPAGKEKSGKNIFVIQKHDSQKLHYDFRLSMDGVLKSWAVPKGLSTAAGEKRLAVRTEDHPLDYADFEGVIPEGRYGAGTVMVWDKGEYEPVIEDKNHKKSMTQALEKGALKFILKGRKLKGGYAMARMDKSNKSAFGEGEEWLIFKLDDDEADARRNPVSSEPDSVLTGRSLEEIAAEEGPKGDGDESGA